MHNSKTLWPLVGAMTLMGAVAACNPTVDPNATFSAEGTVLDAMGQPLANAEVRLIKYSDELNIFAPSTETLFADNPSSDTDVGLNTSLVRSAITNSRGEYVMTFKGDDIAKEGGVMTSDGRVEVSTVVLVVRDPTDPARRAGVYTYPYVFQEAARVWVVRGINLWRAQATADTSLATTSGLVQFSWDKLTSLRTTDVRNAYRVDIGGNANGARLVIRCSEGANQDVDGACTTSVHDSSRLARSVSAYSIYSFYADATGMFNAYVQANGVDYRYVSKFTVTAPVPDVTAGRDAAGIVGVWAVADGATDQDLLNSRAVDRNPATREPINNGATSIYVKLPLASLTDAGLLNSLVLDADKGCVILEFNTNEFSNIAAAKMGSQWTRHGKFCGENGAKGEVSALAGFDTTASNGVTAAWMRLRLEADVAGAMPRFQAIGEIAAFKKR